MAIIQNKAFRASVAVAASITVIFSLSGCFANPIEGLLEQAGENASQKGAEKIIEDASGIDVELDGELPEGFPSEIPLVDGEIVMGMAIPGGEDSEGGWSVSIQVPDAKKGMSEARQLLLDAGFAETTWSDSPGMEIGAYKADTHSILIGVVADGDGDGGTIGYTVIHSVE